MKCKVYSNFNRSNKFLGIIDYKSICFIVTYIFVIFKIINIFSIDFEYKLYIFMVLVFPIISLCMVYTREDSAIDILFQIFKFMLKKGTYTNLNIIELSEN